VQAAALVEAGLRAALAAAGCVHVLAGFDLYRVPVGHPFLHSLALPRGEPPAIADRAEAIDELIRFCAALGLVPRIELVAERRAGLRDALAARGFRRAFAVPVLAAVPSQLDPGPGEALRLSGRTPERLLRATLSAQHRILGAAEPSPAEYAAWRACLEADTVRTWIRLDGQGEPAAAASLLGGAPAVELAGLWSRADLRGRGLARSVARAALAAAGEGGCLLVWAGAANPASLRLLSRLGLHPGGTLEGWERLD